MGEGDPRCQYQARVTLARLAVRRIAPCHGRFGSKADVTSLNHDVRFTPKSGHSDILHCSIERRYSITSSAMLSSPDEGLRPSALAVLRLITSSNLVGCWIGRSAGLAPLRMRSMYSAAWRNSSGRSSA